MDQVAEDTVKPLAEPVRRHHQDVGMRQRVVREMGLHDIWEQLSFVRSVAPVGSVWRHRKGGVYRVTGYARNEDPWQISILYLEFSKFLDEDVPISRLACVFLDGRFTRVK